MKVLVTGAAGFIGFHSSLRLLAEGHHVIGLDNLNEYYDPALKKARLDILLRDSNFEFHKVDISKKDDLNNALKTKKVTHILHLAAQAGVRYSLENPAEYIQTNLVGHFNVLEYARFSDSIEHLVYASSSSVYGDRDGGPFSETDVVRNPASLYAATKIGGEVMSQSYYNLYKFPQTALRFFTVYGPWGRPDMAYYIFTDKIFKNEAITLYAPDEMQRDFTYIDDITAVIPKILLSRPEKGHAIYNLGNSNPNTLGQLVESVEKSCKRLAQKKIDKKQNGDVTQTFANVEAARADFGFKPTETIQTGIPKFVEWYKAYYKV